MSNQALPTTTSLLAWTGEFIETKGPKSKTKCRKELTALVAHAVDGTSPDPAPAEDSATAALMADLATLATIYGRKKTAVVNELVRVAWIRYEGEPETKPVFQQLGETPKRSPGGSRPSGCSIPPATPKPVLP